MKLALIIALSLVLLISCVRKMDCDVKASADVKTIHEPTIKELQDKVIPKAEVGCRF
jgi:hypothetical protein